MGLFWVRSDNNITEQSSLVELTEKIQGSQDNISLQMYTPLQLASNDAYITFEDETASVKRYQGKVWSQKMITPQNGMNELLLLQEKKIDGSYGNWTPFLFRSSDPDVSITALFDMIPRSAVDPNARSKLTKIGYGISWTFIAILVWIIIAEVQIDTTFMFFLMLTGFGMAIASTLYYEMKRLKEDMVHVATIFPAAPNVSLSRSFIHPISGEVFRFAGEVMPVEIKSSKVSYAKIRGYSISRIAQTVSYALDIKNFKAKILLLSWKQKKGEIENGEYEKGQEEIRQKRQELLTSHSNIVSSGEFDKEIQEAKDLVNSEKFDQAVVAEIEYQDFEFKSMQSRITQLEIERDKYAENAQRWIRKANSDLNNTDLIVAARLAKIIKDGVLVDTYQPEQLPNNAPLNLSNLNANLISAFSGFLPFILIFTIGMMIYNTIQDALSNLGEWASVVVILVVFVASVGIAIFTFGYAKSRIRDSMNNTSGSQKVVQQ